MKSINDRLRQSIAGYELVFWLLVAGCAALILMSYPMMKLRYDLWDHVDRIRVMILDSAAVSPGKRYWYACWAFVFKLFAVTDIFTIAIVIHRVQFIANCVLIYVAAKQLFEPLLSLSRHDRLQNQWLSALSLSSVLIWLGSIGTFSFIQQAWIMWYSVNYQITLSFLFLSVAQVVNILTVEQSKNIQITKSLSAFILLILILLFHAGELAYFIFYIPIFIICFIGKFKINIKYAFLFSVLMILIAYLASMFYTGQTPLLITLLKNNDAGKIMTLIQEKGTWNAVQGGNRYSGNWNELYTLSVITLLLIALLAVFKKILVHKRVLAFIVLSLVFCFAPTYIFSSGFLSLVSYDEIVNRYYFASFLFLSIPLCIYLFILKFKIFIRPLYLIIITFLIIFLVYSYSKFVNEQGIFYKNIKSIAVSLKSKGIEMEVSQEEMTKIGEQIQSAELSKNTNNFIYCGLFHHIYIARYVYDRKNVFFDRLGNYTINDCEQYAKNMGKNVVYIQ